MVLVYPIYTPTNPLEPISYEDMNYDTIITVTSTPHLEK